MQILSQVFKSKTRTLSFEVFPVSTAEAYDRLLTTLGELCALKPDFISCTYGAGGGNRDKTLDVVQHIQTQYRVPAMAHLTCVAHNRADIEAVFKEFEKRDIRNILALRGDPPKDKPHALDGKIDFRYSSELVAFIRQHFGERVTIGVAGFPEGHMLAPNKDADAQFLKQKIAAGADFVITQLFFDNRLYFDYVTRLRQIGVTQRVIPGVLPITDYKGLVRFCERCGASIPKEVHAIFGGLGDDPSKLFDAGVKFAVRQCRALLDGGAPGIHFYTLNKSAATRQILAELDLSL